MAGSDKGEKMFGLNVGDLYAERKKWDFWDY